MTEDKSKIKELEKRITRLEKIVLGTKKQNTSSKISHKGLVGGITLL